MKTLLTIFALSLFGQFIKAQDAVRAPWPEIKGDDDSYVAWHNYWSNERHRLMQESWRWKNDKQYWGGETNGIKAGLLLQQEPDSAVLVRIKCVPILLYTGTTNETNYNFQKPNAAHAFVGLKSGTNLVPASSDSLRISLLRPPFDCRLTLLDNNGKSVKKTTKCLSAWKSFTIEKPLIEDGWRAGYDECLLSPNAPESLSDRGRGFFLNDYFEVQQPGKYHLLYRTRIVCWKDWQYKNFTVVELPIVDAEIEINSAAN